MALAVITAAPMTCWKKNGSARRLSTLPSLSINRGHAGCDDEQLVATTEQVAREQHRQRASTSQCGRL